MLVIALPQDILDLVYNFLASNAGLERLYADEALGRIAFFERFQPKFLVISTLHTHTYL